METNDSPSPDDAAVALAAAEASRTQLARSVMLPSFFYVSLGASVAFQIATTAFELAGGGPATHVLFVLGLLTFGAVAGVQLMRFRRLNGVWVGGLASSVVFGSALPASACEAVGLAAAALAAFQDRGWLVVLCAVAGGAAYAVCGRVWFARYRRDPAGQSRGESMWVLLLICAVTLAGLALLLATG